MTLGDEYADLHRLQSKELNSFLTRNSTADLNKPKYSSSTYSEMT